MKIIRSNRRAIVLSAAIALIVLIVPATSIYYQATAGKGCTSCHEIWPTYNLWTASTHRSVNCQECHTESALNPGSYINNLRRVMSHWRDEIPEQIRLNYTDVQAMVTRCRYCHRQEFADWQSGPHSVTYAEIFLDKEHNHKRILIDDCLRCHGMHFEGGMRDLVTPIDTKGPWRLKNPAMASQPVIPCLACHSVHRRGAPLGRFRLKDGRLGPQQELFRPSLALFDRRDLGYIPASSLPLPKMLDGDRPVKISPDPRQALCYQCHAPLWNRQVGYGDDRTPIGVHEGLSCLACHQKHRQTTRASCADCHPRLSNCGLDVEKMDTTFLSPQSRHNIHFVKCIDCHPKGVPPKRGARRAASGVGNETASVH
jgi:hypothetical protein